MQGQSTNFREVPGQLSCVSSLPVSHVRLLELPVHPRLYLGYLPSKIGVSLLEGDVQADQCDRSSSRTRRHPKVTEQDIAMSRGETLLLTPA